MKALVQILLPLLVFFACLHDAQAQTEPKATDKATQTVRGKVIDTESQAPIPGVMVVIQLDSTKRIASTSDRSGNFRLRNVPLGRHSLKAKGIGYQEQVINEVMVTAGKETILEIALVEKVIKSNEVVVTFNRAAEKSNTVNEYATVSSRAFNIEDTKKYAGALGDPSRMAQNFAGVTGANDSRNDIVVRGNSPTGMLWQLEGLNIPNPNHFGALNSTGGPVSILNNNTLDKSDFFSGAFPAQYGNATAGVFDLRMRNGNSDKHEFVGQVGFNGFELGAEGPINAKSNEEGSGSSYLLNYRYSTLGFFKTIGVSFGTGGATPNYQDMNMKVNLALSKNSRLSIFGLGGLSDIDLLGNDQDTTDINLYGNENQNTRVKYKTGIAGISYESNLSDHTFLKLTLGASGTHEQFNGDSIDVQTRIAYPEGEARFITEKYSAVAQLRHKFDSRNSLSAGLTFDRTQFHLMNKDIQNGVDNIIVNTEDGSSLLQGYAQWKHRFTDELMLITGLHAQHYSLGDAVAVEPRASIQYTTSDGQSLSLGYGLHSQAQSIYNYFVETKTTDGIERTNINMDFTRSHHLVLGYDWNFAEHWRVKAEAYYQSLYDIPVSPNKPSFSLINTGNSFAPTNEPKLVNQGTARNYGVELTLERFFNQGFYLLGTASFFDSKYKGSDGVERNTAFNMGYVANILGGKEFSLGESSTLSFSLRLSTTGGRYLTPLDAAASKQAGYAVYDETHAYTERQSAYFRADLKIGYKMELGGSTMEFSLDLQNVTNHKNIFQQAYNRRTNSITTEYQQGFFPVPTFRYTF